MPLLRPATRAAAAAASALVCLAAAAGAAAAPSIAGTRAEIASLGREVAALDIEVGEAVEAHNLAIDRLEAAERALSDTRGELTGARRDLERSRSSLSERLVALYVGGQPSFVEILLTTGSLAAAEQTGALLDQVARRDAGVVVTVRERRARLQRLERARERAESGPRRRAASRRPTGAPRWRRWSPTAARCSPTPAPSSRARWRRSASAGPASRRSPRRARARSFRCRWPGRPRWAGPCRPAATCSPSRGPRRSPTTGCSGAPGAACTRASTCSPPAGTPVVAVADGSVFRVGYNGLGGWRLWVRDTGGNTFYYAHLDAFSPAAVEGASVARGTVLGYVGDSGDARGTSPHLHFEIHPGGGGPVPPYPIVTGWPRAA